MKTIQRAVFSAALCILSLNVVGQDNSFLTNGLVAYYPLNGNANDASGNGLNGAASNVSFTTNRFGIWNEACSFLGNASSFITINSTLLNLNPDFTISVWVNYTPGQGSGGPRVFSTAGYEITVDINSGRPNFNNTTLSAGAPGAAAANPDLPGVWTQLVGVRAGNELRLYVNGVLSASVSTSQPPDYSRGFLPKIGGNSGISVPDNFGGLIDDLRIYNRALSAAEIAQLYKIESFLSGIALVPSITITTVGSPGAAYSIQYSTDLTGTNWSVLASNLVPQNNFLLFVDTNAFFNQSHRYYRILTQ